MTETTENTDRDLIRDAAGGDKEAFDDLVERHYRVVFSQALRVLGNRDDAADATQVTFMKAHRSLGEFDTTRPIRPWLNRICANVCMDMIRSRYREHDSLDNHAYMLESSERPEERAEERELQGIVRRAIQRLPARYRKIIVMRHYGQMNVEEIAGTVGAPEGTIKSWLFRARALLKRELMDLFETERLPTAA